MNRCTSLLLIDEHIVVRAGIALILKEKAENILINETDCISKANDILEKSSFDIAIFDINTKSSDGIRDISRIKRKSPEIGIIVLSNLETEPFISKCFEAGVDGYLSKRCTPDELIEGINQIQQGNQYMSADIARHIALEKVSNKEAQLASLTQREHQVLTMLAMGKSAKDISEDIHISKKTVYVHRDKIMKKLKIKTNHQLIMVAQKHNIV